MVGTRSRSHARYAWLLRESRTEPRKPASLVGVGSMLVTMRLARVLLLACLAGCGPATSTAAPDAFRMDSGPLRADAGPPIDATSLHDAQDIVDVGGDANTSCPALCDVDGDCVAACGKLPDRTRCCDAATRRCFSTFTATCPVPPSRFLDSGLDAASDAACLAEPSTMLAVHAPDFPGATLRAYEPLDPGLSPETTLDASGDGAVQTSLRLSSELTPADAWTASMFAVELLDARADAVLPVQGTVPSGLAGVILGRAQIVVRREIATGDCVAALVSVDQQCVRFAADYDPTLCDDAPCGPFR